MITNEEMCRRIVMVVPDGIWVVDPEGRTIFNNKHMAEILGAGTESLSEQTCFDCVFPDDLAEAQRQFARGMAGSRQPFDFRLRRNDGSAIWVSISCGPVMDDTGVVVGLLGLFSDITERKLTEAKLQERDENIRAHDEELARTNEALSAAIATHQRTTQELERTRQFLDLVVENIPAMLFVKDAKDNRFVLMNRTGEELLGYDRAELIGKNDYDFFPKEQADAFAAKDREVLSSGKLWMIPEERVESRTKGTRLLQTKKMPVFDAEGRPAYLLGLSEDITERKAAERRLQQAVKMEAIGQLTGGMAHDFNNLLTVILSNAETVLRLHKNDDDLRELAEMTAAAARRGAELINQLLAFARRQPLEPRAVDMGELVKGMDVLLRRVLGEDIEIELVHCAGLWAAMVDAAQLELALLNLCLNARDAMPQGGRLTIEMRNVHIPSTDREAHDEISPGQYVLLSISDTGKGMPPEVLARAFEPFFSTKKSGKGTGLGLSIVYGFVKQSGGHIESYSEVGRGSCFKIYLPQATAELGVSARSPQGSDDVSGTETVLVVEDDNPVRAQAERVLRAQGYQVLTARNGPEAMAILERGVHVDILFTDVVMPGGMDGRRLANLAAALRPSLKILFTSGYSDDAIFRRGQRWDRDIHLIRKPYDHHELALKLRQMFEPTPAAK